MRKSGIFRFILIFIPIFFFSTTIIPVHSMAEKVTSDPAHKGFQKRGKKIKTVEWKDIPPYCMQCSYEVSDYNLAMKAVMKRRHMLAYYNNQLNIQLKKFDKKTKKNKSTADDIEKMNMLQKLYAGLDNTLKKNLIELELTAEKVRREVEKCEVQFCKRKKGRKTKFKPGVWPGDIERPLPPVKGWELSFPWEGPYHTECYPCERLAQRLNELPTLFREHSLKLVRMRLEIEENNMISKILELTDSSTLAQHNTDLETRQENVEKKEKNLEDLAEYFSKTKETNADCILKYCGKRGSMCPVRPANTSITVGSKSDVGTTAYKKIRLQRALLGLAPKFGLGGEDEEPKTKRDRVKSSLKETFKDKPSKTKLTVGGKFSDDGLLISSLIKKSPGDGTFQQIYLENPRGCRIYPIYYWIFSYWAESTLSVSWSSERYTKNRESNKKGTWEELGRDHPGTAEFMDDRSEGMMPIWVQMGFSVAANGVRSLGTVFPVDKAMLEKEPLTLVVHVTRPKEDPVTTVPFIMQCSLEKGKIRLERIEKSLAEENEQ